MARIEVNAAVTGSVWKIEAEVGQAIEPGATLMILESMKMEIPVVCDDGGVLREILVAPGAPVTEGQVVAILEG